MRKIIIFLVTTLVLTSLFYSHAYARFSFKESFNKQRANNWDVVKNNCYYRGALAQWEVLNGKYGIIINGVEGCSTFTIPKNFRLSDVNNFKYELDMELTGMADMDRGILITYQDANNWYGVHTIGQSFKVEKVINGAVINAFPETYFPFEDGKTYHFIVTVLNHNITVQIADQVFNFQDTGPYLTTGTVGLIGSTGANLVSAVWFDNISTDKNNIPF